MEKTDSKNSGASSIQRRILPFQTEVLYEKIYDKILELAEYDASIATMTDASRLSLDMRIQRSAYGALVDGHTVCTGYARGFEALCKELNLPCWIVSGTRDGVRHTWNLVKTDGELLYIDCTAGDTGSEKEQSTFLYQRTDGCKWVYYG